MDGLLIRFAPGMAASYPFWHIFDAIRPDLDRLYWCFDNQPWMGAPPNFDETACQAFPEEGMTSIQLWRPKALGRYANQFAEEYIQLWGIDPQQEAPILRASQYSAGNWDNQVILAHASVWLLYTDSTCWEIYAREERLLKRLSDACRAEKGLRLTPGNAHRRKETFHDAGLRTTWQAMHGKSI